MKPGRIYEAGAALGLCASVVNGVIAYDAHNESVRAEATAAVFAAQGNPQAAEWQARAADKEASRSIYLGIVLGNLGTTAVLSAAAGAAIANSRRRREQEPEAGTTTVR